MEMTFKHMVEHARQSGTTNEKTMWESIESFSELLEELEESHPDLYWEFMRKQHGLMFHNHYDEAFALYDVAQMHYTGKTGELVLDLVPHILNSLIFSLSCSPEQNRPERKRTAKSDKTALYYNYTITSQGRERTRTATKLAP